jgi:hypothetical protein
MKSHLKLFQQTINYNLKIIFANKFIYFLLFAVAFFLFIAILTLIDADASLNESDVYNILLFPGLILIFYPTTFGIQNETDTRMIELLFGIPNYRYKVWLIRVGIIFLLVYGVMVVLSILSILIFIRVGIFEMTFYLMFPILFLGSLAFMFSTLIRNGNGTAAIMIILGLILWISSGALQESKWNIFLNPYNFPTDINPMIWREMIFYNRIYLIVGSILSLLAGLYRLQKREKFV